MRMKQIVIFGSTGSVGTKALQICERNPESFKVIGLTTNTNIKKLLEQINQFRPRYVAITDDNARNEFTKYKPPFVQVLSVDELSCIKVDCVINGMVGISGLKPSMNVLKNGGTLGIANKEPIVAAGRLLREQAERYGSTIIPVDSEHSAIFQCLKAGKVQDVKKVTLTASGGPFVDFTDEQLRAVTPQMAIKHPVWAMGTKVSIDSATMMNKGLEFIEAMHLFSVTPDDIQVVIHPQSVIHSMVELVDGTVIAQLGVPDMGLPIQLALTYPERKASMFEHLDFAKLRDLTFEAPDLEKTPCLGLAMDCARTGGTAPCVMSAANEVAVGMFLRHELGYNRIYDAAAGAVAKLGAVDASDLETVLEADAAARAYVMENFGK